MRTDSHWCNGDGKDLHWDGSTIGISQIYIGTMERLALSSISKSYRSLYSHLFGID